MKTWNRLAVLGILLAVGAGADSAAAREETGPPAWDKLKALEGRWIGPAVWDQGGKKGNVQFELSYKVTSAGKAVMETMMPGTPGEMVTVYHLDGEDLVLVHYCTSGNQPRMKLAHSSDPNDLAFRCLGGTNMTEADSHMHSVRLRFVDADHIRGEWSSVSGDVVNWVAEAELERQKSATP
jgi:hypothetical protein